MRASTKGKTTGPWPGPRGPPEGVRVVAGLAARPKVGKIKSFVKGEAGARKESNFAAGPPFVYTPRAALAKQDDETTTAKCVLGSFCFFQGGAKRPKKCFPLKFILLTCCNFFLEALIWHVGTSSRTLN